MESLVDEFSLQERPTRGLHVIAYSAMFDVARELVVYVARLLASERRVRGTRQRARALSYLRQAVCRVLDWQYRLMRHNAKPSASIWPQRTSTTPYP